MGTYVGFASLLCPYGDGFPPTERFAFISLEAEWNTQTILRILQNEKYAGDVLLQKTYTSDFLEEKVKKNNGELPQYHIQNNNPAIIPREMFLEI